MAGDIFKCLNRGAVIIGLSIPERDSVSSGGRSCWVIQREGSWFRVLWRTPPPNTSIIFVHFHSQPSHFRWIKGRGGRFAEKKPPQTLAMFFPICFLEEKRNTHNPSLYILSSVMWPYILLMKTLLSLQPHKETGILSQHCTRCGDVSIGTVSDLQWGFTTQIDYFCLKM